LDSGKVGNHTVKAIYSMKITLNPSTMRGNLRMAKEKGLVGKSGEMEEFMRASG
jgi:hypothetical protein